MARSDFPDWDERYVPDAPVLTVWCADDDSEDPTGLLFGPDGEILSVIRDPPRPFGFA